MLEGRRSNKVTDPYEGLDFSGLVQRDQVSYGQREGFGGKGILNDALVQQCGIEIFNPAAGSHLIDIIPYPIGENDPEVLKGNMKVGQMTYICSVGVHNQVGPNEDRYICMARTLGQPCALCREADLMARDPDADEEMIKALRPARYPQCLYYIWDRNSESKGVQLFVVSYFFMEKDLQNRAKQPRQLGSGKIIYAHPAAGEQGGRHIRFVIEGTGRLKKYTSHEFYVRKQPIPESILKQAREYPPLDAFLVWPDQEELLQVIRIGYEAAPSLHEVQQGQSTSAQEKACPYGGQIGTDYGRWEECRDVCLERFYCEGLAGTGTMIESEPCEVPSAQDLQPVPQTPLKPVEPSPQQVAPVRPTVQQPPRPVRPVQEAHPQSSQTPLKPLPSRARK